MSATARLAEFAVKTSLDECPPEAVARVRLAALDTLGVMLAGAGEPAARAVRAVARAEGGTALCTVVGTRLVTAPGWAALANGTAGHAHDFDDTNFALMGHPSAPLLATCLAAGEAEMVDGRALVTAYVVGFEISTTLGCALNPEHYTRGWHATSSIGTLGCAAAAARLLRLDVTQTRHALAIAASHASGLKENFGSMTKPYHAGHAARCGVLAAQLAREGLTASETALEGRQGYVAAFDRDKSFGERRAVSPRQAQSRQRHSPKELDIGAHPVKGTDCDDIGSRCPAQEVGNPDRGVHIETAVESGDIAARRLGDAVGNGGVAFFNRQFLQPRSAISKTLAGMHQGVLEY